MSHGTPAPSRYSRGIERWDDEIDDGDINERELPAEGDMDADDDPDLTPCPYCKTPIFDEAEVCSHCGSYLSKEDSPTRISWVKITVLLLLAAGLIGMVGMQC